MSFVWLTDVLATYDDDRPAHEYLGPDGEWVRLSRRELLREVRVAAAGLVGAGLRPGDRVAMVAGDPGPFVGAFLGALWAGLVPVPVPPPPLLGRREPWRELLDTVLSVARPKALCLPAAERELARTVGPLVTYEELAGAPPSEGGPVPRGPQDVVYLQFSSGSTARPRAVAARAGAVMANGLAIMREGVNADADTDRGLSWLPLHHDMGLVGFLLAPLAVGVPTSFLPTRSFVRDPGSWMRAMHERSATLTFAPNFAYALAARRSRPESVAALDLSRVRVAGCGGEPINREVLRRFTEAFAPAGLRPEAVLPCYGLAESTLAVTFPPGGRPLTVDRIDAEALARGSAVPAPDGVPDAGPVTEVVGCGSAFEGHGLTIRDERGRCLADRAVGEVWVTGPSVARGYVGDPEATGRTFGRDGWVRTGDRGYLVDGELFVTGRAKDLLIVRGSNTDPQRVEWLVEALPGARLGGVVACTRPAEETEELVVVVECRESAAGGLPAQVRSVLGEQLAMAVHDVVLVRPGTIPRTTSGKPRRQETRRRYLEGELVHVQ
ncbi:fatty-acyl-CoA synthase [Kitasatospora sp. MAA4]|uniref:AMP-binding protein n=1 Tax=Kitasatospora sp. MAA4 TaxID=3035093 RepID=UPI0024765CA9|nr:AMP-binding protein [Kitasatospora sp. MAA4]MDH6137172.1 fatty-acyl-CoA synthase [Kitasatospora sp. MAA4]